MSLTTDLIAEKASTHPQMIALAEAASLAARIETELLRMLRLKLLVGTDAGIEADLFFSDLVEVRSPIEIRLTPEAANALRQRLAKRDKDFLEAARETICAAHDKSPPSIKLIDELTWLAVTKPPTDARAEIEAKLRPLVRAAIHDKQTQLATWAARLYTDVAPEIAETESWRTLAWIDPATAKTIPGLALPETIGQWLQTVIGELITEVMDIGVLVEAHAIILSVRADEADYLINIPAGDHLSLRTSVGLDADETWTSFSWIPGKEYRLPASRFPVKLGTLTGQTYTVPLRIIDLGAPVLCIGCDPVRLGGC